MSSRARGYTVLEVMVALALFTTGLVGVAAMQRASVQANRLAKNIAVASGIADAWLGQLAADGALWQTTVVGTTWLGTVENANMNGAWQLPAWDSSRAFGPEFDPLGAAVQADGAFCAHIRLTWLYRDAGTAGGIQGNGLIRTEVRVFWPRDDAALIEDACTDGSPATITAVSDAIREGRYYVVTQAGAVRQVSRP